MNGMSVVFSGLIRIIHWGIAFAVFLNLFIINDGEFFHRFLGYAAVLLVITRLVYGLVTKSHRQFPNKIAQLTYFSIWGSLFALAVTGYLLGTDQFWGDERVEEIHESISKILEFLIVAHLMGIALDSYKFKRRTWLNMINGKKN